MYHALGGTSVLVRGLVFGIRPSIAWRFGIPLPPLDNLTADGFLGWQVGLRTIMQRHEREPDLTPPPVISWLSSQAHNSQRRRVPTVEILESLRLSVSSLDDKILAMDTASFVQCWSKNLLEALSSQRAVQSDVYVGYLARETMEALQQFEGTDALRSTLFGLVNQTRGSENRVISDAQRSHPPIGHRHYWLDVLAGTQTCSNAGSPGLGHKHGTSLPLLDSGALG